jgi:hypothetical protein
MRRTLGRDGRRRVGGRPGVHIPTRFEDCRRSLRLGHRHRRVDDDARAEHSAGRLLRGRCGPRTNHRRRRPGLCDQRLRENGLSPAIDRVYDTTAAHGGACLAVWTETSTGCRFGADRAGARGRTSEAIGDLVAATLLEDLGSGGTVDRCLADQLVLFSALATGTSTYVVPRTTRHLESNLWLVGLFGARSVNEDRRVSIEGVALSG